MINITILLPEGYRHDHFNLSIRIKEDTKELEAAVATLAEPTAALTAVMEEQKTP